jgi:DnaJ-like protein
MNSSAHSNELGKVLPLRAGGTYLRDHYAALGVTPEADHEVIKAAFRALAKKYHPDTAAHAGAPKGRFREIYEAHSVLSNPGARGEYDRWLSAQRLASAPFQFGLWPPAFLFMGLVIVMGLAEVPSGR